MNLQNISTKRIKFSETNPRLDTDFEGEDLKDLIASIREKGVLVPILEKREAGKLL